MQFVTSFVKTRFCSKSDGSLARLQVLLLSIGADIVLFLGVMKHPIWMSLLQLSIPRLTLYLKREVKLSKQEELLQAITSARAVDVNSVPQLKQSWVILQCIGKGHQCITSLLAAVQKPVTSCPSHISLKSLISLDCVMQCKLLETVALTPENLMNKECYVNLLAKNVMYASTEWLSLHTHLIALCMGIF